MEIFSSFLLLVSEFLASTLLLIPKILVARAVRCGAVG